MSVMAAGYVFLAPSGRRALLLGAVPDFQFKGVPIADPVPRFDHSARAPLVVFGSFEDGHITHVINGRKGSSAGLGLVRLNLTDWLALKQPLPFKKLIDAVPARFRSPLRRTLKNGGLLPPKTLVAVVDAVMELAPETADRLSRFSEVRATRIARLTERQRTNLALQKEALTVSLAIADIDREEVLAWNPSDGEMRSFLDGLPGAEVREDTMLAVDHGVVPDFDLGASTQVASKVFTRRSDGARLTVVMANRTALETQTGADLIYFNERFRAFVFVQYKAMKQETSGAVFRWQDLPDDDLVKEIGRMDTLNAEIIKRGDDGTKEGFRLHSNPFFLKLCPKIVLDPDDKGLFVGMYIPLAYWKRFEQDACSTGPQGGRFASYENIGRRLTNSEFIPLVAGAWVGTTIPQSAMLQELIRRVLALGRTVTLAVEQPGPDPFEGVRGVVSDVNPLAGLKGDDGEEL